MFQIIYNCAYIQNFASGVRHSFVLFNNTTTKHKIKQSITYCITRDSNTHEATLFTLTEGLASWRGGTRTEASYSSYAARSDLVATLYCWVATVYKFYIFTLNFYGLEVLLVIYHLKVLEEYNSWLQVSNWDISQIRYIGKGLEQWHTDTVWLCVCAWYGWRTQQFSWILLLRQMWSSD